MACLSLRLCSDILTHYTVMGSSDTLSMAIIQCNEGSKGKEHLIIRPLRAMPGAKCSSKCFKKAK